MVVQGFFVGMFANLLPLPGGVGGVDAGMIGAFVLFGLPDNSVFAAVLVYRFFAFWLPLVPGIVAFFQLRAHGAALGGAAGQPAGRQRHRGEPSGSHYFIK